ncbi:MAG: hypothetical protein O7D34_06270 [Ignavibacteria bacterium]|nr:hypothetical protein [Ignavibacteria bacterium]
MESRWICFVMCLLFSCTQSENQSQNEWFSTDCSEAIAAGEEFGILPIPDTVPVKYKEVYCKYIKIDAPNGGPIHIFAQNEISNEQMIYARDLLAFYLEDFPGSQYGNDKSEVANKMADNGATLVMRNGYDGKYRLNVRGLRGQPLYDEETIPIGTPEYLDTDNYRDASFEEILHLMHDRGIGIDISGYDEGATPEYQKEIRAALNNAHYDKRLWGHGSERRARWIAELKEEGSLTQEYLAAIVDSYYGLWGANTTRETGIGGYQAKTREAIAEKDPMGYAVMENFFHPYLAFNARIDSGFEGTFSMTLDVALPYTHKSQYLVNATLTGSNNSNLTGNDQDNRLSGNSGINMLDGRSGKDTAVFSGPSAEYKITRVDDGIKVEDSISGRDGTDTLKNIGLLEFANTTLSVGELPSIKNEM